MWTRLSIQAACQHPRAHQVPQRIQLSDGRSPCLPVMVMVSTVPSSASTSNVVVAPVQTVAVILGTTATARRPLDAERPLTCLGLAPRGS